MTHKKATTNSDGLINWLQPSPTVTNRQFVEPRLSRLRLARSAARTNP
jgi:hypothetical protein